jgi:hypothetical protein
MSKRPRIPFVPSEIWETIFHSCPFTGAELKELRLVNKAFNECLTPLLFEHACFSVTEDNIANLKELLDRKSLTRHVKTLWIDCATFEESMDVGEYLFLADCQLEFDILKDPHLEMKAVESMAQILLDCPKYAEPDPSISMSMEERSLQKKIRAYYIQSHKEYLSMAKFQANYDANERVAMLRACFEACNSLESIYFFTDWTPPSPTAIMDWWYTFSRSVTDVSDESIGLPLASTEVSQVVAKIPRSFKEPSFPGSSARSIEPLQLRPKLSGWWDDPIRDDLGQNIRHLVLASSGLRTNLKYLSLPAGRYPGHDSDSTTTIPGNTIMEVEPVHINKYENSLRDLLRPLRNLYLALDLDALRGSRSDNRVLGERWLCSALQSMKAIENLELDCKLEGSDLRYGLFNILLTRGFESTSPSMAAERRLERRLAPCHFDFPLEPRSSHHSHCWRSVWDYPAVPSSKEDTHIRVLEPNPWPRLRRLGLSGVQATKEDMASLFITIASSLRELELSRIVIGKCPCSITRERGWTLGTWKQDWKTLRNRNRDGEPWYDTMVMISNVLDLRKSKLILIGEDRYFLSLKLAKILGLKKGHCSNDSQNGVLDDLLAEYVVNAEGEGLALWLSNNFELEGDVAWSCMKRK